MLRGRGGNAHWTFRRTRGGPHHHLLAGSLDGVTFTQHPSALRKTAGADPDPAPAFIFARRAYDALKAV